MSASNDENNNSVRVLGVCGGIGSGKSTACKLLVSSCRCLDHIDADSVAHSVYAPGSQAVKDVVAEFGTGILVASGSGSGSNGEEQNERPEEIDRKKLGAIVFAEKSAMSKLEAIVWPHVKVALEHKIETLKQEWASATTDTNTDTATDDERRPVVVLEAAVLLDAGWDDVVDGIWAVTVPGEVALNRLVETRGLTPEEAAKRIDAQASCRGIGNVPEEVDNGVVTGVIVNDGSLDDLKRALETSLDDPDCWKK
eukprot:jgi/Psemu1/192904/e_gw1.134.83.1